MSVAKDLNVDDFMQTELATKFYNYWKQGTVTDRLIGQRFGYGVLGRFYSNRLWDQGCFDDVESEVEPGAARNGEEARVEDSFPATQVEEAVDTPQAAAGHAEPEDEDDPAASSSLSMEGSAAVPTSTTDVGASAISGVLSGSRQTSLAHWLL